MSAGVEIMTWADGYGRWYAAVPHSLPGDPVTHARRAIRAEITARGEAGPNWRLRIERVEELSAVTTYREKV